MSLKNKPSHVRTPNRHDYHNIILLDSGDKINNSHYIENSYLIAMKNKALTFFFMLLTISIGLVSVNTPLTVKAQNSILSQSGDDSEAVQETGQDQSSNQDGQVVSGDGSFLSGNNLLCQDQDSSIGDSNICPPIGENTPAVSAGKLRIEITRTVIGLPPLDNSCISPYGRVIANSMGGERYFPATNCNNERLVYDNIFLLIGDPYEIRAAVQNIPTDLLFIDSRITGDCSGTNQCSGRMVSEDGASITVEFRFLKRS